MRNYTTQMDAAKRGIITPEMKAVAAKEYRTEEEIRDLVARGQVAICANKLLSQPIFAPKQMSIRYRHAKDALFSHNFTL